MDPDSLKVFVFSNNPHCEARGVDAARLRNYFAVNGCRLLEKPEQADYIIIFTCGFSNAFEDYYLNLIRKFQLHRYRGEIIVAGCLPAIAPNRLARLFKGKALATCELPDIDKIFPWFQIGFSRIPDANACYQSTYNPPDPFSIKAANFLGVVRKAIDRFELSPDFFRKGWHYLAAGTTNRYRRCTLPAQPTTDESPPLYGIRIGSGCLGKCTYCGIREAIGNLRSKPPDVCLAEYRRLLADGHRQVVIGSEDTGAYGQDIGTTLPALLEQMHRIEPPDNTRWYLTSLKPAWLLAYRDPLLKLAEAGRISHLECPVQSGSARILKLMNRPSDLDRLTEILLAMRQAAPDIHLITHVIVGFPSETEDDFTATLTLLKTICFQTILVNPYDDKTRAASTRMDAKISPAIITARCHRLRDYMHARKIAAFRPRIISQ